jgi:oxalate decarboxylase/phosphoglucose isomerase-like protein (cupin superfamily)
MTLAGTTSTASVQPGQVWFIEHEVPHAAANTGRAPVEFVTVAVK